MKQYFAKYLPVEGEIKEGDMMLLIEPHPSGQLRKCHYIVNNGIYDQLMIDAKEDKGWGFCKRDEVKKAKLFLCSRDKQVGDKVINPESLEQVDFTIADKTHFNGNYEGCILVENPHGTYDSEKIYKVVGEISPEATWVKEGDEFDEEEIEWCEVIGFEENEFMPKDRVYKIKGPCGYFH